MGAGNLSTGRLSALHIARDLRAGLDRAAPDSFAADFDTARGHQLLHVTEAQSESKIEPDRLANDLGREPVTLERDRCN